MKFSVNWLREFVELPSSMEELAELLTLAGIEIEGIEKRGANFDKVVVAQITASSQHPNADRLSVCQVDDGSGQTRQIVCGAKNYKVGDKVPLALPGAVLRERFENQARANCAASNRRECSAAGSNSDSPKNSDGLLILSPDARIGAPIGSLFPADTILDVEITPNRGDLLSHFGLAREIAALVGSSRCDDRGRPNAPSSTIEIGRRPHFRTRAIVRFIPRAGSRTSRSVRARIGCAQNWNRLASAPLTTSWISRIS